MSANHESALSNNNRAPLPRAADMPPLSRRMTVSYRWPMRWMRRRGDRVTITTGRYSGNTGTVESNVFQKTVDYPDEWANGLHIMLDTGELVTVRHDQVQPFRAQR